MGQKRTFPKVRAMSALPPLATKITDIAADGFRAWGKHRPGQLQRDVIARQLRDGSRLGLDAHLAVSLRNIARTVPLNGVQNAVLNARVRNKSTPSNYLCFDDLAARAIMPRAIFPLAKVWQHISAVVIFAQQSHGTVCWLIYVEFAQSVFSRCH